jgi:Right handed beta helix region/IPT/TIG domain
MKALRARDWIHSLVQVCFSRRRKAKALYRPQVELLEDRVVPTNLVVTTVSDAVGHTGTSLRDAVATANTDAGVGQSDTITFASSLNGQTITLTQGQLTLTGVGGVITIDGANQITVNGNNHPILKDNASVNAVINNLTFTAGGNTNQPIYSLGNMNINSCTISGCITGDGGAVYNTGTLSVANSTITGNTASGLYNQSGTMTVVNTVISNNNAPSGLSGGLECFGGTVIVRNSTIHGNTSGATGGGVFVFGPATATIMSSTISGNSAPGGGGIGITGVLTLENSTVANNTASQAGGGIAVQTGTYTGILTMVNSTVSGNSGPVVGGINTAGSVTLFNSIIASNGTTTDIQGTVSGTGNLVGNGTGMTGLTNGSAGNQVGTAANPINPRLNTLSNNGGATQTMSEQTNSPAIGSGGPVITVGTGGVNNVAATIPVANGNRFAASPLPTLSSGSYFTIQIGGEQMACTGSSASTLTVVRGINGTTATTHVSGGSVFLVSDQRGYVVSPNNPPVVDRGAYQNTGSALLPTVVLISPNTGPTAGSTSVIIMGTNFTGATAVRFGGTNATTFTVNSDSQITATAPSGTGVVDVTVITAVATSASSSADHFTYVSSPPPSITNVVINQDISALYNAPGQPTPGVQRSMVNDIVYTFSEAVNILSPSVDPNVFTIAVATGWTGIIPTLSWAPVSGSGNTQWAVSFSGNGVNGGSIANGVYTITVSDPSSITAVSDGQALLLQNTGIGSQTQTFYRLFGDLDGTAFLNTVDVQQFMQALVNYNAAFDYNQDGFVNAFDNQKFKQDLTVNDSGFTVTI